MLMGIAKAINGRKYGESQNISYPNKEHNKVRNASSINSRGRHPRPKVHQEVPLV
jgi:hypothetical protein